MTLRRLSHFELHEKLGAGGMGVVYRAVDTLLQRAVAIKMLSTTGVRDMHRARLLAEARAASSLSHPGIVTIYEVGTADGVDFIAMELVAGRTLADELASGPLPQERVRSHARQLAEALAVAHRHGIIHRDLKPANIVVTEGDRLKILDFGLAKQIAPTDPDELARLATIVDGKRTAEGAILGTPAYMSPEQARGQAVDARADLFALGTILYEALTGELPFRGRDVVEMLSALLRDTPPLPSSLRPGLAPGWDPLLARLLAKSPAERFASAAELLAALDVDSARAPRAPSETKPRRSRAIVLVAVAVVVAAAATIFLVRRERPSPPTGPDAGESPPELEFRLFSDFPGSHREPSISPDASTVAFVSEDAAGVPQIWVRAWSGGDPIQITHGEPAASAPRWSRGGERIVFARAGAGIWQVPPLGGQAHRLVEQGSHPSLSPAGDRLVYLRGNRLILAAGDGRDARPLEELPESLFGHLARAEFSPDGSAIVAWWPLPERPYGDLWLIDAATGVARRLTDLGFAPSGNLAWSSDGSIVFASDHSGSRTLWRVAAAGGEPRAVTRGAGEDFDPTLSADGRRLVYTNARHRWQLVRLEPASGQREVLFEQRRAIMLPRLSPDGRRAAYFARAPHAEHLYVLDLASGQVDQLTHGERVANVHPRWNADGTSLIYYRETPEPPALRRIRSDGSGDKILRAGWRWTREFDAQPSPDGARLVYTLLERGVARESRVVDLASGDERPLPDALFGARWSVDGGTIYGTRDRDGAIVRCPLGADRCATIGRGWYPIVAPSGRALWFLGPPPVTIWRRDLARARERAVATLDGYEHIYFAWSLAPDGTLVFPVRSDGREELWVGEAIAAP